MAQIINFSEAASIGLHGMIMIAKSDEPLNAIQLSEMLSKSKHHIGKVLQRLVKDGYLYSYRGPNGGFTLRADPADVTLLDLYEAVEGKVEIKNCPRQSHICPVEKCIYDSVTGKMTIQFIDYMKSQTLKDYL
jgi:Rrf2 family protein